MQRYRLIQRERNVRERIVLPSSTSNVVTTSATTCTLIRSGNVARGSRVSQPGDEGFTSYAGAYSDGTSPELNTAGVSDRQEKGQDTPLDGESLPLPRCALQSPLGDRKQIAGEATGGDAMSSGGGNPRFRRAM
ncbi:hypothetical protein Pla52o_38120 [Novipirellula galeiformis]|uniref:Uncharacterized protein n=1 Tax=Novipirellula galeiformis TaxID=2528004 RepID=A0A5C6CC76_9BACT|nr:hypothetical protein Pla52o_38120 [Novipirellula galeiformis]